jgi:hypothetical protein
MVCMNSQDADSKMHTFEIVMGRAPNHTVTRIRATLSGAKEDVLKNHPDRSMRLRGYTTWRIYQGKADIGSMQRIS